MLKKILRFFLYPVTKRLFRMSSWCMRISKRLEQKAEEARIKQYKRNGY